jgi:acylphosphatase
MNASPENELNTLRNLFIPLALVGLTAVVGCRREATPAAAPVAAAPVATPQPAPKPHRAGHEIPDVEADHARRPVLRPGRAAWQVGDREFLGDLVRPVPQGNAGTVRAGCDAEHIVVVGLAYEDTTEDDLRAFLVKHPVVYPMALVDVYNPPADFDTPRGLPFTYLDRSRRRGGEEVHRPGQRADARRRHRRRGRTRGRGEMSAARFIVRGKVQGVWFRASTREQAARLGLDGHARNLGDGSVEVIAIGDAEALDALERWLHVGPAAGTGRCGVACCVAVGSTGRRPRLRNRLTLA